MSFSIGFDRPWVYDRWCKLVYCIRIAMVMIDEAASSSKNGLYLNLED
jgi:hypothetical protein